MQVRVCPFAELSDRLYLRLSWLQKRRRPLDVHGSVSGQCTFAVEVVGRIVESAAQSLGDCLDLWRLDDQWGRKHQPVADHAQDQPASLRSGADASTDPERRLERNAGFAVLHQLHAEDEANRRARRRRAGAPRVSQALTAALAPAVWRGRRYPSPRRSSAPRALRPRRRGGPHRCNRGRNCHMRPTA